MRNNRANDTYKRVWLTKYNKSSSKLLVIELAQNNCHILIELTL